MGSGFIILKLVDDYTFYGLSENFQIVVPDYLYSKWINSTKLEYLCRLYYQKIRLGCTTSNRVNLNYNTMNNFDKIFKEMQEKMKAFLNKLKK